MTIIEQWASLPILRWLYEVSNLGRIRRADNHRLLKPFIKKEKTNGYCYIKVCGRNLRVHQLVAMAFIPNPYGKKIVHHIDNNKTNNIFTNLKWVTNEENLHEEIKAHRIHARMKRLDPYSPGIPFDFEGQFPAYPPPQAVPTPLICVHLT